MDVSENFAERAAIENRIDILLGEIDWRLDELRTLRARQRELRAWLANRVVTNVS
jgi:hypothetical protein